MSVNFRPTLVRTAVLAALATPIIGHTQAAAPAASAASASELQSITVTATRREDSLQDVPAALTAITAADLQRSQIVDVKSLSARAPSLLITDTPVGKNNMIIGMRGITPTSISSNNDPTVGVYVNGVYYARTAGANAALVDMQQVEVIRGPQGTLFGRNTIGGALNMTTQRPTNKLEGSVRLGLGNYGERNAGAVLNVPLMGDKLAVRLVADHAQHDGFGKTTTLDQPLGDDKRDYLRFSLRAKPVDALDVDLYLDRFKSSANSQVWVLTYFDPAIATSAALRSLAPYVREGGFESTAGFNPRNTADVDNQVLTLAWHAPQYTLKSITARRAIDVISGYDLDATPVFINQIQRYGVKGHQLSQELQAYGGAFDDKLEWIAGVYGFKEELQDSSNVTSPSGTNTLARLNAFDVDQKSTSIFAQGTWNFTPQLRATAGARAVRDTRGIDYHAPRYIVETGVPLAGAAGCPLVAAGLDQGGCRYAPPDLSFKYMPWTLGVDYKPDGKNLVYGKVTSGFRSGGFQPAGATNVPGYLPFDKEKVVSFELGTKWLAMQNRLRLNAAAYVAKYTDIQQIAPHIPAGSTVTVSSVFNAGEATVKGLEFDAQLRLPAAEISFGLGVMDPEFTSGPFKGQPFVTAAKTTASLGIDVPLALGLGKVNLHADYRWQSKVSFFVPVNTNTTPFSALTPGQIASNEQGAYGLINAMVTLDLAAAPVRLSIWGRNLANQYYKARSNSFYLQGYNTITPGDPRTVGMTAEYRF
jgi:iron complex outermembrane receptor protein